MLLIHCGTNDITNNIDTSKQRFSNSEARPSRGCNAILERARITPRKHIQVLQIVVLFIAIGGGARKFFSFHRGALQRIIEEHCVREMTLQAKITLSAAKIRRDRRGMENKTQRLNCKIKAIYVKDRLEFLNNDNIDDPCLGIEGLHLTVFAKNILSAISKVD